MTLYVTYVKKKDSYKINKRFGAQRERRSCQIDPKTQPKPAKLTRLYLRISATSPAMQGSK